MVTIKRAGVFWGFVLAAFNMNAVYAPNGRVYLDEWAFLDYVLDRINGRRNWLVEHEMAHHYQRQRDGWLGFWVGIVYCFIAYGHAASPYEIEANDIADMAAGW